MSWPLSPNRNRNAPGRRRVIAHVIDSLTPGGTQRTLVALLRVFDRARFEHVVITMRNAGELAAELPQHVACRALHIRGAVRFGGLRLAAALRDAGADLVHARNTGCWFDAAVARLCHPRAGLVLGYHGSHDDGQFDRGLLRKIRFGVAAGGYFTSVSEEAGRRLHHRAGVPATRIEVLCNGVDASRFACGREAARDATRKSLGLAADDFVIGAVGSLTPVKRYDRLLDILASAEALSHAKVLLVGDGSLREALARRAGELGIERRLILAGPRDDVPALLRCMDVYVCCSAAEGISNALLEAMAAGRPVVTTDVGDHAWIVRDGIEGRVVPDGAGGELCAALMALSRSPAQRTTFGEAARRRVAWFSFDRTVRAYEAFYERMLWRARVPGKAETA